MKDEFNLETLKKYISENKFEDNDEVYCKEYPNVVFVFKNNNFISYNFCDDMIFGIRPLMIIDLENKNYLFSTKPFNQDDKEKKECIINLIKSGLLDSDKYHEYLNEKYGNDKDVVMAIINNNPSLFATYENYFKDYISDSMKNNKDVAMAVVRISGTNLQYVSKKLKDDKDVVLGAVKNDGYALFYTSDRLKDDTEVVEAAIKSTGYALKYASDRLKKDKDIRNMAIKNVVNNLTSEIDKHTN